MRYSIPSRSTLLLTGVGLGLVALTFVLVTAGVGGDLGIVTASDVGELMAVGLSAAVILLTANSLGIGSLGKPWLLIGLGALSYAIGDAVWTVIEIGMRAEVPYPGLPDLFYLLEYPLFAAGIIMAGRAFKGLVDVRKPAVVSLGAGLLLSAAVYVFLLKPYVWVEGVGLGERILSTLYPLGDVMFMVAPALFMVGVVRTLGGGRLAWPWWSVAAGSLVIAVSDAGYAMLSASDLYQSGSVIDYGWGIGHVLVMLGALLVRDMAAPQS